MAKNNNSDPSVALRRMMKVMDKQKSTLSGMLNVEQANAHGPLIGALRSVIEARSAVNQAVEAFERDSLESLLRRYVDDAGQRVEEN